MSAEWRYAVVTGTTPLTIRLDGDDAPLADETTGDPIVPEYLGAAPPNGARVWVQMTTGAPIIHGVIT
ncbi:MAG TPA: hypothetical protein VGF17_24455 [Phytomonospora sp.]